MSGEGNGRQAIRKLTPGKLVLASHNKGKIVEFRELLAPYGMEVIAAGDLDLPEPEETGTTFVANAELKALRPPICRGCPPCRMTAACASRRWAAIRGCSPHAGGGRKRTSAWRCARSRIG